MACKFFKEFFPRFKKVIGCVDELLTKNVDTALAVTKHLKSIVQGTRVLTTLTPFGWDDIIAARAEKALEYALQKLDKIKDKLSEPQLRDFIQWLKLQPEDIKDAYLHKISSLISEKLDDNRFQSALYDTFVQARYIEKKDDLKLKN